MAFSRGQYIVLANAWLLGFSMYTSLLNVSPIMSLIQESLRLDFIETALIFSLPLAFLAAFAWFGGFVADRVGPRRTAGIGAILLGLGDVARAFSSSVLTLIAFTAVIGIGLAFCFPNLPKIMGTWFPAGLRGTASGIYGTGIMVGSTMGLGGTLPLVYPILRTWNGVFLIWGLLSLAISAVWWTSMRRNPSEILREERQPGMTSQLLRSRSLWVVAILLLLENMVYYMEVTGLLPFFSEAGASQEHAAFLQSLIAFAGIPSVLTIPALSDRLRTRKPFLWVAALISAAAALAMPFTPSALFPLIPIALGVTASTIFLTCLILPIDLFPGAVAGTASGLVISVGYLGGLLGPALAGYLADVSGGFSFVPSILALISLVMVPLVVTALRNPFKSVNQAG